MPIKLTPRGDGRGVYWDDGGGVRRIDYVGVPGAAGSTGHRSALQAAVQAALDTRQRLSDLPLDDPDRAADPARADLYWGGQDGRADASLPMAFTRLVARSVTAEIIGWDGTDYVWETSGMDRMG